MKNNCVCKSRATWFAVEATIHVIYKVYRTNITNSVFHITVNQVNCHNMLKIKKRKWLFGKL